MGEVGIDGGKHRHIVWDATDTAEEVDGAFKATREEPCTK